jgi:hypothetical protein
VPDPLKLGGRHLYLPSPASLSAAYRTALTMFW